MLSTNEANNSSHIIVQLNTDKPPLNRLRALFFLALIPFRRHTPHFIISVVWYLFAQYTLFVQRHPRPLHTISFAQLSTKHAYCRFSFILFTFNSVFFFLCVLLLLLDFCWFFVVLFVSVVVVVGLRCVRIWEINIQIHFIIIWLWHGWCIMCTLNGEPLQIIFHMTASEKWKRVFFLAFIQGVWLDTTCIIYKGRWR